jgi:hypothetical protein
VSAARRSGGAARRTAGAMALGKRKLRQTWLWVDTSHLRAHAAHPFYRQLNEILDRAKFDRYVQRICGKYYAPTLGGPSGAPGVYFRCFLVGYFEGIDFGRGIAYHLTCKCCTGPKKCKECTCHSPGCSEMGSCCCTRQDGGRLRQILRDEGIEAALADISRVLSRPAK